MEMMLLSFLLVEVRVEWDLKPWEESSIVSVVFVVRASAWTMFARIC